jgi:hypothetical protein
MDPFNIINTGIDNLVEKINKAFKAAARAVVPV